MLEKVGNGQLGPVEQVLRDYGAVLLTLAVAVALMLVVQRLLAGVGGSKGRRDGPGYVARAVSALVLAFTTNWQLTLLAVAATLLSLAAGWRTWDGMQNFTGEPVASFLMTFGIQSVMLIIAWLIGESFASGLRQNRSGRGRERQGGLWSQIEPLVGGIVGILCAVGVLAAIANVFGAFDDLRSTSSGKAPLSAFADKSLYFGVALLVLATLLINQRSDILQPYVQSARLIAKNAALWIMFLLCMATGVFFSFDSFFTSIFPPSERARSADIRSQRQIAGVVNDIGVLASRRQAEEAEGLFRSPGWIAYEKSLAALVAASQGAEEAIERYFVEKMEAHRRSIGEQQERMSSAKSGQAGLLSRKAALTDEISRLKGERPAMAADLAEKKTELENRNKNIDAKRVEVMAEERGAEGTLKVGKGPVYRQRMAELEQLKDAIKIQEERVRDAQKRVTAADTRIAGLQRELAAVDGDLAKLKGEAETAEQRIAAAEAVKPGAEEGPAVDPARVRSAFERANAEFRQEPTVERLSSLSGQCSQLLNAMLSVPVVKDKVRSIDCDPKQAAEAAGRVFALNAGLATFATNCAGGARLPKTGGTDAMLEFGRQCLQDSGLPSTDSGEMAAKIAHIDLNRDDKAHRFVVTWNAFLDGNRLAYLSLAIAIALDSLIFMAGLFGANAVRSPLTDIDHPGDMTADQLDATIDATLGETIDPRATLSALLGAMHPIENVDGFSSEIILDEREPLVEEMRKVLNAGSQISAVRPVGSDRSHYLVHSGLARYLALAQRKPWTVKTEAVERKDLEHVIGVALLPDPQGNAEIVLGELHPISDAHGFAAEAQPFKIADLAHRRLVINTLGAGATIAGAVRRNNEDGRYFVSTEFYKTLLMMRAAAVPAFRPDVVRQRYASLPGVGYDQSGGREQPRGLQSQPVPMIAGPVGDGRKAGSGRGGPTPAAADDHGRRRGASMPSGPSVPVVPAAGPTPPGGEPPPLPHDSGDGDAFDDVAAGSDDRGRQGRQDAASRLPLMHDANLADEIRADIIHMGGLHAWSDREIGIARTLGAESEPEQALRRLSARAPRLADLVGQTIDENRASLRDAYDQLRAHNGGDAMYNQVLETVAIELDELMPILMLTPGGPYQQILDRLIYDLEGQAGEGALSPADDALLARARAQVAALKALADGAPDRYVRLVRIIDQYDERDILGQPPYAAAKSVQKRSAG